VPREIIDALLAAGIIRILIPSERGYAVKGFF
jgi:hypothetical protein